MQIMPDQSVVIHIIDFLCLIWILNIILYKPIRQILLKRKEKINGLDQKAKTFLNEAEQKNLAYDAGIKAARAEGLKEKQAFLKSAAEEERKIIEEINAEWAPKHGQAWDTSDMEGIRFFLQQGNEIIGLDAKESERWAKAVEPLITEYGKQLDGQGLDGKTVIKTIRGLLKKYEK